MPKFVPPGLLDPGRILCYGIRVLRKDGVEFGLTDTNVSFEFPPGSGVIYSPVGGVTASTIQSDVGTSAGSLNFKTLEGVVGAVGKSITDEDVRGGRYNDAQAWVYELDPTAPELGAITHNRYLFARANIKDAEKELELRETLFRLRNATGRTMIASCDVERVWNKRCDPHQTLKAAYSFTRTVSSVPNDFTIDFAGDSHPSGYFTQGFIEWTGGKNAGLTDDVKLHQSLPGGVARITLKVPPGFDVDSGDVAKLVRGCDRRRETCATIDNPNNPSGKNIENHQGFGSKNGKGGIPIPDDVARVGRQAKK